MLLKIKHLLHSKKGVIFRSLNLVLNLGLISVGIFSLIKLVTVYTESEHSFVSDEEFFGQSSDIQGSVDLSGSVNNPGVYDVKRGERIIDVIESAGGFNSDADLGFIHKCLNLSALIQDQQKIYLPAKNEEFSCNDNISSNGASDSSQISLNNSSIDELKTLPGIGDSIAQRIIEARPFSSIEELKNVKGIGDATFEKLIDRIKF